MRIKKKIKLSNILFLTVVCFFAWFGYSYIGVDKETQVPKALLMKIRPLPWEEIYWDEDDQLLKLTVKDETLDGEESRCLRIFKMYCAFLENVVNLNIDSYKFVLKCL